MNGGAGSELLAGRAANHGVVGAEFVVGRVGELAGGAHGAGRVGARLSRDHVPGADRAGGTDISAFLIVREAAPGLSGSALFALGACAIVCGLIKKRERRRGLWL